MEPTTKTNQTKIAIIILILIILAIGVFFLIKGRSVKAPVEQVNINEPVKVVSKTVVTEGESKEITKYLEDATTFDNEPLLKEIDKEF